MSSERCTYGEWREMFMAGQGVLDIHQMNMHKALVIYQLKIYWCVVAAPGKDYLLISYRR